MNLFLSAVSIAQMFLLVFRFLYRYIINADCMEKQMPVSLSESLVSLHVILQQNSI